MDMGLSELRSWWWTGKLGVLQSMRSQRVGCAWATRLKISKCVFKVLLYIHKRPGIWERGNNLEKLGQLRFAGKCESPGASSTWGQKVRWNSRSVWWHRWQEAWPSQGGCATKACLLRQEVKLRVVTKEAESRQEKGGGEIHTPIRTRWKTFPTIQPTSGKLQDVG